MHGYLPHMPKSPLGGTHENCLAKEASLREGMKIHSSFRHRPTNQFLSSPWCWKGVALDPTFPALAWCHRRWSYWNKAFCKGAPTSSQIAGDTSLMGSPVSLKGNPGKHVGLQQCLRYSTSIGYLTLLTKESVPLQFNHYIEHGISKKTIR